MIQAVIGGMVERRSGRIINISSVAATGGWRNQAALPFTCTNSVAIRPGNTEPTARPEEPPSSGGVSKGARWDFMCKAFTASRCRPA
jgi:NAD(P)-dependent dehydrogenase (short-subunit alcohol dehydrogenase family)